MPDVPRSNMEGQVSTNLGRVALRPRGPYVSGQIYDRLDLVKHDGSGWICLKDGVESIPEEGSDWTMYVERGEPGEKGKDGTVIFDELTPEQKESLRGPKGDPGKDSPELYAFKIKDGHLILCYSGNNPPAFSLGKDGHLYYDAPPKLDLGRVVSELYPLDFYAYDGVDLTVKFSSEISKYDDVWAWLKARLTAQDISGLHIKDYVPLTVKNNSGNNVTLQMQIADINHDLGFMDAEITKFHIDFISKDLWPELHVWNKVNYNNGLAKETDPWLCSDLCAWLNSKKMQVPNATTVNPEMTDVDYTTTGVLDKLPATLQSIIVEDATMALGGTVETAC